MPLGSRTPTAPPRTDSGVCAISPSDLVGYTANLMNEMRDLRQRVSELEAANVEANQLSDLSQQIGWVGGITYMGTAGWTRTAAGTLIPPPGFYIGNVIPGYHAGFYDATGTLQLGFGTDGQITGAQASTMTDYIVFTTLTGTRADPVNFGAITTSRGSTITRPSSTTISIASKGMYAYSLLIEGVSPDNGELQNFRMNQTNNYPFDAQAAEWAGIVDNNGDFHVGATLFGLVTAAPSTIQIDWSGAVDASSDISLGSFVIAKIQNIV